MKHELISMIVPVYNVEAYIRRCVDSILEQSYKHIEVILVDDGTPDHSGTICDEYAASDPRVKVIHQKNMGLSEARNSGMREATGEYLCFIDSDDFVHCDYCSGLLRLIQEYDAPMAVCGYEFTTGDSVEWSQESYDVTVRNREEACITLSTTNTPITYGSECAKRNCLTESDLSRGVCVRILLLCTS